jgi:hypothetical protein
MLSQQLLEEFKQCLDAKVKTMLINLQDVLVQ